MLEDNLSDELAGKLINDYFDLIKKHNPDGWESEEVKEFYQRTVERYPSIQPDLDSIRFLMENMQKGHYKIVD